MTPELSAGTWSPKEEFQPEAVMLNTTERFPVTEGRKHIRFPNIQLIWIRGRQRRLPGPDYTELGSQLAL